jgi:L-lactate dehydrogenase (cytochrome)
MMRDRGFIERLIERARAARCGALVLTLDLQILGQRHKDLRNGLSAPPRLTLPNLLDIARRPRWWMGMLGTKRRHFGNIVGHVSGVADMSSLAEWTATQFDPALSWADIEWIKKRWGGKLILKGILDVEDARLAADSGADALIVSNHGGRQLDGAPSSIAPCPRSRRRGHRIEVWMDGGITSGQDVLKAWALGARGTMIGRSFLYGLGAMGEAGVTRALEIIRKEMDLTMAFCGHRELKDVGRDILLPGRSRADVRPVQAQAFSRLGGLLAAAGVDAGAGDGADVRGVDRCALGEAHHALAARDAFERPERLFHVAAVEDQQLHLGSCRARSRAAARR